MWILTNIHHSLPNENLREDYYGLREAYGSERLMLRALSAGFGKTNARATTVAGLVWPRHYGGSDPLGGYASYFS